MALWLLGPDPAGNCCDCTGRTSPCDNCAAPSECPCTHNFGPDLSLTNTFPTLADAQFIVNNYTNNCFGVIQYVSTYTVTSFTATETVDGFTLSARSTRTPGPTDRVANTMQVGFYAAAGTLTIDYSTSSDGSSGTRGNAAVLVICNAGTYSTVQSQSVISDTGTFTFTISTAALYIVRVQGTSRLNGSYVQSSFDFSFSSSMVIAPAVAQWDDGGTTRQLEVCPKMLLPPLTESTGSWYASLADAQSAITNNTSNCVGYRENNTGGTFTATAGGASLSFSDVGTDLGGNGTVWGSINANAGATLSISFSDNNNGDVPFTVIVTIYNYDGATVQSLTNHSNPLDCSFTSSPLVSSALPYTGRYIVKISQAQEPLIGCMQGVATTVTSSISDATLFVNQIQALYDVGLTCPARDNC